MARCGLAFGFTAAFGLVHGDGVFESFGGLVDGGFV